MTSTTMRSRTGIALALVSAATFGTSGSFARSLTEAGWSPEAAVAIRIGVAAVLLAVPAAMSMRGRWQALRANAGMVAVYGLVAVAGCQVCFFNAVQYLPVGVALLLEYLGAVLVVAWLWLRHRIRPRRLTVTGSLVALTGLVLVLGVFGGGRIHPIGVLWGLGAACGLAVFFFISSRKDVDLPPIAVATAGMIVGTAILGAVGAVGALRLQATFGTVDFGGHRTTWLVPVVGLALIAAAVAYVTGIAAARTLGPKLASFIGLTEVVFAVLVASVLLGELPTVVQSIGGALIVTGVALVRIDELPPGPTPGAGNTPEAAPESAPREDPDEPESVDLARTGT